MLSDELLGRLHDMDQVAELFNIEPFDLYLMGGSACLLANYTQRMTLDFDFIDLNYTANMGRVFAMLRDFDMLEYESTILSPSYKSRASQLQGFKHCRVFTLSKEDIIVSKIVRLADKDIQDLDVMMPVTDLSVLNEIIEDVLKRENLYESKLNAFIKNLIAFKERYHV